MTNWAFIGYFVRCLKQLRHRMSRKITYFRRRKMQDSRKIQMVTISSIIPYISETNNTCSSLKKKKPSREKVERKKRWKRGEEEKRDGKSLCERKGKRENEMWKKRRNERRENREGSTRNIPPSPDAFPSTKLGNNITPIKGRVGKNTTPTSRGPTKPNQNSQADPR